jgi:hemerythrin superfamily protein
MRSERSFARTRLHDTFKERLLQSEHMNATEVIARDHRAVEDMFDEYKSAPAGTQAVLETQIFKALDTHEKMEDVHFYPVVREALPNDERVREILDEQEELERDVREVMSMGEDRKDHVMRMMERVLAHALREERDIFPSVRDTLDDDTLDELGHKMEPDSAVANALVA